jgi:hypothetical protein
MTRDAETQAALDRIRNRIFWTVGWLWCAVGTLAAGLEIVRGWSKWNFYGRYMAGCLIAFLILFPVRLLIDSRKQKPTSVGFMMFGAYVLLFLATETFRR